MRSTKIITTKLLAILLCVVMLMGLVPFSASAYKQYSYNANSAAAYALQYWDSYNPNYSNYNSIGGDCCNFVSQCLYAGGLQMDDGWYWYSYSNRSGSWTVCSNLKNYLCNTLGCQYISQPSASQVAVGDVLYYNNGSHVAICSEVINGTPWVCSHNNDRHYSSWTMGYSSYGVIKLNGSTTPPTFANLSISGNVFNLGENIILNMQSDNAASFLVGIDRYSADGIWLERFLTQSVSDGWSINTLPAGYYSAYVTASNSVGWVDSNRVYFTVDPVGHYINLGNWFRGTFLNLPNWRTLVNGDNSNVYIDQEIGSARELWTFTLNDDGSYKIRSEKDGKCLQVENASDAPGTNVNVGEDNGSSAQRWYIYSANDGGYILRPKCSSCVLDLTDNNSAFGTNIIVWTYHGGAPQRFSVYQGEEVLLCAAQLSVDASMPDVKLSWNDVPGESYYRVRIYDSNNTLVHEKWEIEGCSYTIKLAKGNYKAVVHSYNWSGGYDSNTVSFSAIGSTYSVKFNGNGATSGSMSNQAFTYDVAQNLTANAFKRAYTVTYNYNYSGSTNSTATATATFNGWATSADGAKVYNDKQSVKNLATSGTYNLYANWTLGTVTLPTPTRTGYTFAGWNTKADGTGTNYAAGASYKPTANVTLYAKWTANPPVITPVSGAAINSQTHQITGLTAGGTSAGFEQNYVSVSGGSFAYEYPTAKQVMGTGTKIKVYNIEQTLVDTYTVVIFGDVDGDGWYDGTDAYFVRLVANGLIARSALTDAQRMAADCNHDGLIDSADVAILEQAGLLLNQIDQNLPSEEPKTNNVYLDYCSLIDQSIEIVEPEAEQSATDEEPAQPAAQNLFSRMMAIFTAILNRLLGIFKIA